MAAEGGETLAAIDRRELGLLYRRHGAVLLRGYASDVAAFGDFAAEFCPVAVHNESRNRVDLGRDGSIQSVNLGVQPFPLHPELSREPWKPDTCLFYCIVPPASGGATTVCDGIDIVRNLPADLVSQMRLRRLKYLAPASPEQLVFWIGTTDPDDDILASPPESCPYRFERVGTQLARAFTRPLLHEPMFSDELAFGNFLLFARYLRGVRTYPLLDDGTHVPDDWVEAVRRVSDSLTAPVDWKAGDLLILDNTRFMHGRTAVTDPDNRLIATYFGYLADAPPNIEEPVDPVWRRPGFVPPATSLARGH
jgi:alpha-ketoglutarate-dependent taurine dioxygenase